MDISLKVIKNNLYRLIEKLKWKVDQVTEANRAVIKLSGLVEV